MCMHLLYSVLASDVYTPCNLTVLYCIYSTVVVPLILGALKVLHWKMCHFAWADSEGKVGMQI